MASQRLDRLDKQILRLIAEDARIPFLEVARACNVSGAAIHQRIQKLTNAGILKGSQFVIDPEKIGYETCAYIGLNLKNPERFDAVVEELKKIPFIKVMPSQANYFFLEVLPPYKPKELCATLLKRHNILASACLAKKGIEPDRYMRIAVRNHSDNEKFIQAMKELIR